MLISLAHVVVARAILYGIDGANYTNIVYS
jgi:hypothetical protein